MSVELDYDGKYLVVSYIGAFGMTDAEIILTAEDVERLKKLINKVNK